MDQYKYPKAKLFLNFFLKFLGYLSTGTLGEIFFFSSNIHNSPYILLNPKNANFSPFVPLLSPQEIQEKNSKENFFGICILGQKDHFYPIKSLLAAQKKLM